MDEITYLLEVDEKGNPTINDFGNISQIIFKSVKDAIYYLYIMNDSKIEIIKSKNSNSFSRVIVTDEKRTKYYNLVTTKPMSYDE